jgi:pimeloyl-ACP methyl ester carboxylesterase
MREHTRKDVKMNLNETTTKRRTFVCIALAATVLGLILMACGRIDTEQTVPAGAKPGELTLAPCQFKTEDGEYEADCGTLVVPENRAKPDSRLIALPVIRVRATGNTSAEPIFWLTGGPGQNNMKLKPPAWMFARHDFVMVGYRGADGSSVLDCPEYDRVLRSPSAGGDGLSAESLANVAEAMAACAARLQAAGVDLEGYTTPEVVEDLEAARKALGYARVNLSSASYGTRVAQMYAYLHPERIYRSVMSAASVPGGIVMEPERLDAQLRYYARLCAQDAACSARTPDLAETIRRVAHNMPRRWLFLPIDPGNVKVATVQLLYSRSTAPMAFDAYLAAEQGDPSGLALMSLAAAWQTPTNITWGAFFSKAYSMDYDPSRNYAAEMDPAGSILGSPYALGIWSTVWAWPVKLIAAELRQVQPSDVETLLISGSVDVAAPAERATEELLPYLSNGQQVILAEMSHADIPEANQPQAIERLLTSFYDTGVADDSLFTATPIDFRVSWGYPVLAKLAFGLVLLISTIVAGVIWLTIRRLKRRAVLRRRLSVA